LGERISSNPEPDADLDRALVARARAGDTEALDALVAGHQDRVFSLACRMLGDREDALDVCQEVFLTVFQNLGRFEERARFSTWLYRVAVNRCRDELRRRGTVKHTRPLSLDRPRGEDDERNPGPQPVADGPRPEQRVESRERRAEIEDAVGALPDDLREVVVLRDLQQLSYEELAALLGIPIGTVRSRLHRAREVLRERLRPLWEGER
jgi:RNA polymerase sigma-70 factor (ECF subfamily)